MIYWDGGWAGLDLWWCLSPSSCLGWHYFNLFADLKLGHCYVPTVPFVWVRCRWVRRNLIKYNLDCSTSQNLYCLSLVGWRQSQLTISGVHNKQMRHTHTLTPTGNRVTSRPAVQVCGLWQGEHANSTLGSNPGPAGCEATALTTASLCCHVTVVRLQIYRYRSLLGSN